MPAAATLDDARALWPDAGPIPDATLQQLLEAAWETCEAFLPADALDAVTPPRRYVHANVLHARDLWTSYRREGDVVGFDTYAVRVRPLSDSVRALLRPQRGRPQVG